MQPFTDAKMNEYFASLPAAVQESVLQCGAAPSSLSQLQSLATKLMDGHGKANQ